MPEGAITQLETGSLGNALPSATPSILLLPTEMSSAMQFDNHQLEPKHSCPVRAFEFDIHFPLYVYFATERNRHTHLVAYFEILSQTDFCKQSFFPSTIRA